MSQAKTGMVYLVGAGPGDLGLLTLRGADLLRRAEVVIHDALLNPGHLRIVKPDAEIVPIRLAGGERHLSQEQVIQTLIDRAKSGRRVVRLKGGDPYVFGRGGEEAAALAEAGIPFEVVPGVSSFAAAPALAGIPLTHRGIASAFSVHAGHEDPSKSDHAVDWTAVAKTHGTKVVLMGVHRLEHILSGLIQGGLSSETPAAAVRWGTTPQQSTVVGTLGDLKSRVDAAGMESPAVIIVGDVVRLRDRLNWFEHRDLFGQRIVVTRARDQASELGQRLAELGAQVLEIPTIRAVPPREREPMVEALAGLGEYDWIVFSSPNGVRAFFDAMLLAFDDIRALGQVRLAAVGPATAACLKDLRLRVDAMPTEFLGKNIAKAIAKTESLENLRVLVARAAVAGPDLCRELEEEGAIVDDVAFYQTEAETQDPGGDAASLEASGADWITFTSGSTVEHFHTRFDLPRLLRKHPDIRLATIGPETTKALTRLKLEPTVEAKHHTLEGLIQALVMAKGRPGKGT
ncbi:MAG: uroporphyrinogen-III C-methyltransferase [Verrucomicrobiales bacterium]|nr:uroporphyrinogen-III C-methyltransferase [Verrucomicrobiales bacterium]